MEKEFTIRRLSFRKELPANIEYKGSVVGRRRFDFSVEGKIIVELKVGRRLARADFEQVYDYLMVNQYKLGILLLFNRDGVIFKRIPNLY